MDSIVAIGARLGVVVTAEGIEDVGARDHLRRNGCPLGQGYLFSRPTTADDLDVQRRFSMDPLGSA